MSPEKRFAVTGNPVLHSKSPFILNSFFRALAVDAVYTRIAATNPLEALYLFRKLGLSGMNVTSPFKKSIMPFLDSVEDAAAIIGGVNTIVREADRLRGYNTDYIGVIQSLKKQDITITGKKCVVLGAGGAGRAAVYGLLKEKGEVTLVNRTYEKAVSVGKDLGCRVEKLEMLESLLQESDIFISTLSSAVDLIPEKWLPAGLVVVDANYKQSPLALKAAARKCLVIRGEAWLLNQAIPAFNLFFPGEPVKEMPPETVAAITRALLKSETAKDLKNISLVGFMGSGKSLIGKKLAKKMSFSFIDTDQWIESQSGRTVAQLFAEEGESGFRDRERAALRELLPGHTGTVISCGGGMVLDERNRKILAENSVVLWLYASIKTTLGRIRKGTRPLLAGAHRGEKARNMLNDRLPFYTRSADIIINSEKNADQVLEKIYEEICKTCKN